MLDARPLAEILLLGEQCVEAWRSNGGSGNRRAVQMHVATWAEQLEDDGERLTPTESKALLAYVEAALRLRLGQRPRPVVWRTESGGFRLDPPRLIPGGGMGWLDKPPKDPPLILTCDDDEMQRDPAARNTPGMRVPR